MKKWTVLYDMIDLRDGLDSCACIINIDVNFIINLITTICFTIFFFFL